MKKVKSKSFVSIMLAVVLVMLSALTGCGTNNNANEPTPAPSASGGDAGGSDKMWSGTVRVQMIGDFDMKDKTDPITGQKVKGLQVVKDEFEKQYPGATLEFVLMGWDSYVEKTQTMLMSDSADVYQVPGIANFASQGLLEPLQPYIDRDNFDLSVYIQNQVEGWMAMGPDDTELSIYGFPFIGDTRVIVYDKKLFDDWGVEYLSKEPTLDELMEKAKKMTGKNPKTGEQNYGVMYVGSDAADTIVNISEGLGGTWGEGFRSNEIKVNFDTPTMIEALNWMKEINAYAPPGVLVKQGTEKFLSAENDIAINLREIPSFINKIEAAGLQDRYGVSLLFVNPEKKMGGLFAGSPYAIAKNSKNKDLAWEYLKFSSGEFFQQYMWENQRSQSLPVIKAAEQWDSVKAIPQMSVILESMGRLWAPRFPYRSLQPRYIIAEKVEQALLGNLSPEEALKQAQKESDDWVKTQ